MGHPTKRGGAETVGGLKARNFDSALLDSALGDEISLRLE
jgi:hypothetical protein